MLYKYLPNFIFKSLFGDRKQWGNQPFANDKDFIYWMDKLWLDYYMGFHQGRIASTVNHLGFKIMNHINLNNRSILEVGPGNVEHLRYTQTRPREYIIIDLTEDLLTVAEKKLNSYNVHNVKKILLSGTHIPLPENHIDIILTFHQLEHVHNLTEHIDEFKRILKNDGLIVGAVPAEGGLTWGIGRFFTTRRYIKKNLNIDFDKIICWEHPNFVDAIKKILDREFTLVKSWKKPLGFLPFDLTISWSFIYKKT
ncbi:class I SAM-dependent methyltransferase [bacterium]|nr:class I SAM-dependent methyltransferase [bacterium]